MLKSFLIALVMLVSGCQLQPHVPADQQIWREPRAGGSLVLHQAVQIPIDSARMVFQLGQALGRQFDIREISCSLEVRQVSRESPQTVAPDTFRIRRVQWLEEQVAWVPWRRTAAVRLAQGQPDSGPSEIFLGYHFWLESERQPDVRRLTCRGMFDDPWSAKPPSLAEIRQALGDYASLNEPAG